MLVAYLKALRIEQWTKNLVVFAALIFAKEFTNLDLVIQSIEAFILFCLASSAIYLINDAIDAERDRKHPEKAKRPIASGEVNKGNAIVIAAIFIIIAAAGSVYLLNIYFFTTIISYLVLMLLYSLVLKQIVIIDVMVIATGFVLRAVGGAVAIMVEISPWLIICTILLALFIGFGKRRHELTLLEDSAADHRGILEHYSVGLLDQLISIVTAATIIAYAIYTLFGDVYEKIGVRHLELTIPFVIYGIFRYLYLIHKGDSGGTPTRILYTDLPILFTVLLWIASVFTLMYISHL
ncbi:MAG: decaprenyl-phosphate phosphoribosyltransferase [candidate division Zixibacteria bacterium]|nr:decaprenyl-phosphate phosphoribosyltransferase [candidate division Zixibacteria bacterium]NIR63531.1 decaprenyl-phosphate phosphoribosyltransferase [candidate division Zixibacteria bacterium]NIS17965.1 decaprenyl-phosphate phosphoribosyltransferase [candidate division Zixibacteria bacterium]NIS46241.1 decaprenyl-phosphate phosphoribosyltransferase [candidate division Zixibacteria bacterium]NIT54248.1 decaprenyl-phosphate phosphoribosyltransferase [candidate division Zixibacteria bacterium]